MPGYREFRFGDDRRKVVQFMKLFKLGQRNYRGVNTPYLYDETWVLEHLEMDGDRVVYSNTTAIYHTNKYID
jgi:hypothetical protein